MSRYIGAGNVRMVFASPTNLCKAAACCGCRVIASPSSRFMQKPLTPPSGWPGRPPTQFGDDGQIARMARNNYLAIVLCTSGNV
ncbi:hypothetical protein CI102_2824 [Trichoderma harzianum]|nr:hypothetical protein CI102_2824 [Trichoderma harzianum]